MTGVVQPPATTGGHIRCCTLAAGFIIKSNDMDKTPKLYCLGETEGEANLLMGRQGVIAYGALEGDARGQNSTDLQFEREQASQVASGNNSFIGAGASNKVAGNNSFAAAGSHNDVAGNMGFAAGESNTVSGNNSAAFGYVNDVLGNCSHALGTGHVITDDAALAEGDGNIVSAYAAHAEGGLHICEGRYSHAEGLAARAYLDYQHTKASGGFSFPGETGEAQYTNVVARLKADDNYPLPLILGEEGVIALMNNKVCFFKISVVASTSAATGLMNLATKAWELKGIIAKACDNAGTSLLGPISKLVTAGSDPEWDVNVEADTTNGALRILASAPPGREIRWVAFVEMVEVAFYS